MEILPGVWLHDHFYRKHCGKALYGLAEDGWLLLNTQKAAAWNPAIFDDMKKLGVECVELGGGLARAEQMKESLKSRQDISIVLHTEGDPGPLEITSKNKNISQAALFNIFRNIDLCRELNAEKLVLHPPPFSNEVVDIYKNIIDYAESQQVIMAIENSQCGLGGMENLLAYKKQFSSEFLKFTFDTGHANIGGNVSELLKMVIGDVSHIHWHDNDGSADQHLGPGMGNIDFHELVSIIKNESENDITISLECDKPCVDYEKAFKELKGILR